MKEETTVLQPLPPGMLWFLALLPLLLRSPLAEAGNRFHERNHTGLLVLYGFDDGQRSADLHPTSARDYTGRGLLGNLTTSSTSVAWDATQQGLRVPGPSGSTRAVSQQTSASLLSRLSSEYSIEFFVLSTVHPPEAGQDIIAGFGDWQPGSSAPLCDANTPSDGGWRLVSAYGDSQCDTLRAQVSGYLHGEPACFQLSFANCPLGLRHLVLRARDGEISIATHGGVSASVDAGISFAPSLWARRPTPLSIAVPNPGSGWVGSIYSIAFYDRYLSDAEVAQNLIYGPPNSLPVASVSALSLTEDLTATLYP